MKTASVEQAGEVETDGCRQHRPAEKVGHARVLAQQELRDVVVRRLKEWVAARRVTFRQGVSQRRNRVV
jgi:hypothetical protein